MPSNMVREHTYQNLTVTLTGFNPLSAHQIVPDWTTQTEHLQNKSVNKKEMQKILMALNKSKGKKARIQDIQVCIW